MDFFNNLPDWVHYITVDANGGMFGWEARPVHSRCGNYWTASLYNGRFLRLEPETNWREMIYERDV